MLFHELSDQYTPLIKEAIEELFNVAERNQVNDNDLLLILIHGFKLKSHEIPDPLNKGQSPYVIGPDKISYEEHTFFELYSHFAGKFANKAEYNLNEGQLHEQEERIMINLEFLIYLKIWENDFFLRQLFNLCRLANQEPYSWDFKPEIFNSREKLIYNKIITKVQPISPRFNKLMADIYSAQIRGAISHSKFIFSGKGISFTNTGFRKGYDLTYIEFNRWYEIYNKTFMLYNEFLGKRLELRMRFIELARDYHYGIAVTTPEINSRTGFSKQKFVKPDESGYWRWNND